MSQQPPYNGELGSSDRPTTISTDVLELLTQARAVDSLVGLARDSADRQDGTVVYADTTGGPTDLAVWVDGVKRPVTAVEWVDSGGVARPVTEWHLGPRSNFSVTITGTNGPVTEGETVDMSVDVTNTGAASATDTITLSSRGQTVDSQSVSVGAGQTTSITLQQPTSSGDAGTLTLTVSSSDDSAQTTVTVEDGPPGSAISQWDADALSGFSDGDTVSTWTDNIGPNDVTGGSPVYKTGVQNGLPVVRFDGADDQLSKLPVDTTITPPYSWLAVVPEATQGGAGNETVVARADGNDDAWYFRWEDPPNEAWHYRSGSITAGAGRGIDNSAAPVLIGGITTTSDEKLRVDGSEIEEVSTTPNDIESIELAASFGNWYLDGSLAEVVLYDADIEADGDLQAEETRLSDKWGISI